MELNSITSISNIKSIHDLFSTFSCFCLHPLFSTFVTLYTLILLYAPSFFLRIVLCPVLNSTGIILLFLLRLGTNERSRSDSSSQEIRKLDLSENKRLEKDSNYLEPKVLDHKDKLNKHDGDNMALYSSFVLESTSLEQRFLNLVDHNQANINFKAKEALGFGSNQTKTGSNPNSSVDQLESNQMSIEFKHDIGLESNSQDGYYKLDLLDTNSMESSEVVDKEEIRMAMDPTHVDTTMKFLEWNMKEPLEIIYEEYEGEDEDKDTNENNMVPCDKYMLCERYPWLSMCYRESESDSSSEADYPVKEKWEAEEDEREELIEISLDCYGNRGIEFCQDDEDNLIEIDIFP